jgi:sulfite reductase alpha subunit-like flavoprotein
MFRLSYRKGRMLISGIRYRIVGKGNHSIDHVQKIKPRVERICQELGLQYKIEPNPGRIYINLQGGPADTPLQHHAGGAYHGEGWQPQHHQQHQQQQTNDQTEEFISKKVLSAIFRELKACCIVM